MGKLSYIQEGEVTEVYAGDIFIFDLHEDIVGVWWVAAAYSDIGGQEKYFDTKDDAMNYCESEFVKWYEGLGA